MTRNSTGCRVTSMSASGVRAVLIRLRLASASECRTSRNGRGLGWTAVGITERLVRGAGLSVVVMLCLPYACSSGPRRRGRCAVLPGAARCRRSCGHLVFDRSAPGEGEEHLIEAGQVQGKFGDGD